MRDFQSLNWIILCFLDHWKRLLWEVLLSSPFSTKNDSLSILEAEAFNRHSDIHLSTSNSSTDHKLFSDNSLCYLLHKNSKWRMRCFQNDDLLIIVIIGKWLPMQSKIQTSINFLASLSYSHIPKMLGVQSHGDLH